MSQLLNREFFAGDTVSVARALIGVRLIYNGCEGIIVETEAYRDDPASHAVTRPVKGAMLRETYGKIYIYFIYGMYHCLNFTTEKHGVGAVLIRAVEPVAGIERMMQRRRVKSKYDLTNGPAKLFQAFGFDLSLHGQDVGQTLQLQSSCGERVIESSPRVGISKATELPWRFCMKDNPFVGKRITRRAG